jgi:iron-sulfur cluster assembly 1
VDRLQILMSSPTPQLVRIGVRNKGCAGLSYHLEYVDRPGKFDEVVEQNGVKVVIDSKALFSIIGSEMDWHEDALRCVAARISVVRSTNFLAMCFSSKFVFKNPNITDACGCGESFTVTT